MGLPPGETMSGGSEERMAELALSRGVCYLVEEKKPDLAYRLFKQLVPDPLPGLVITRLYPERARRERALPDTKVIWLSHTPGEDNHNPTAIGTLAKTISRFI